MGRKILVICTVLALALNIIGTTSMNNVSKESNSEQVLFCDQGDVICNLQLKL